MNKIVLAIGLLAITAGAQADCTSTVNGFYGSIKVGYGVTSASDKITTKKASIAGKKNYRSLGGGLKYKGADGKLKDASEAEYAEYQKIQNKMDEYNDIIAGKKTVAFEKQGDFTGFINENANVGGDVFEFANIPDSFAGTDEVAKYKAAVAAFQKRLEAFDAKVKDLGLKTQIDGKEIKFANLENINGVAKDSIFYKVPEGKTLDIVSGDKVIYSMASVNIGDGADNAFGIPMLSSNDGILTSDDANNVGLERELAKFEARILGSVLTAKYPGIEVSAAKLADVSAAGDYAEELKATTKEVKSHKNNMNIGLSLGYQHAFGVFYTGVELGAEFTPGKIKIQNVDVDGVKAHQLGSSTFTYDKEIARAIPEISLKTKYSFSVTPMFGITSGNWMFYIPVTLKFTKYDLSVTPSSTFSGVSLPTVSYPETNAACVGPYMLSDVKVSADGVSTTETTAKAEATKSDSTTTETSKETTMSTYKKGKTKFGVEFGLGAKVMLSKNVFVGLRYMYSPKTSIKIDTPAYKSNALHDPYRLGANHKVSVSSHKGVLEIGYKF